MNKSLIFFAAISLFLTGCVGFYMPEDYDQSYTEAAIKEERIHDSIEHYVQGKGPVGYNYKSLEFGELYVIKDDEIKKLDKLIEEKNQLPLKVDQYGSDYNKIEKELQEKIDKQKAYLKENKIYPWYEVNHLYAFENLINDSAIIYEFDFEMYPNYTVKDVHMKMTLTIDAKQYKTLKYFLDQKPVYDSEDWEWEQSKNREFYNAAFTALENETVYKDKLLLTLIRMTDYIKSRNDFDESDFAKKEILKWEKDNVSDQLKTISISQLKSDMDTVDNQVVLVGYHMEHEVYTESIKDKTRYDYYFDLNYVITRVTEEKLSE